MMGQSFRKAEDFRLDSAWANRALIPWTDVLPNGLVDLVMVEDWQDSRLLDISSVVGSAHPDHAGMTWIDMLLNGPRMKDNLDLFRNNPDYYIDRARKVPVMEYVSLDEQDWFIGGDGHHRTCIARFAFAGNGRRFLLGGVSTRTYFIDTELHEAIGRIKHILQDGFHIKIDMRPRRRLHTRYDEPGWRSDHYSIRVEASIPLLGWHINLSRATCLAVRDMLEREPRFRRYLPGYRPWLISKLRHFAGAGDDL